MLLHQHGFYPSKMLHQMMQSLTENLYMMIKKVELQRTVQRNQAMEVVDKCLKVQIKILIAKLLKLFIMENR